MKKTVEASVHMIADIDGDAKDSYGKYQDGLFPILPTRNMVLFPGVMMPILVGRDKSRKLVEYLEAHPDNLIGIFCQKNANEDYPDATGMYSYGVLAKLVRKIEMPDNVSCTAIFQTFGRCQLMEVVDEKPYLKAQLVAAPENIPSDNDSMFNTAMSELTERSKEFVMQNDDLSDDILISMNHIHNRIIKLNFLCTTLPFTPLQKNHLLSVGDLIDRAIDTLRFLNQEEQLLELRNRIRNKTREDLDAQQREYYLQQMNKNIMSELGRGKKSPEIEALMNQAANKDWPLEADKLFYKEIEKFESINPQSPEYNVMYTYLQLFLSLPWNKCTRDDLDLKRAQRILDKEHYGMEKVKERILEYISVLKLRGDLKSPILCLYGPPGVGKTSLGKSIAQALRRQYVRVSLGGLHDESEIRGHRRTYVGAMPGRIIKGIQKAGSSNPVFILDEIDKVGGANFNGDPSSALLEVLDPEQNNAFHDNYLDTDYDLSKVMFMATANDLNTIPRPLLDRMEIIEVSGYITEEKVEIARRHLAPREIANAGLNSGSTKPTITKAALDTIIERYTRVSGVRQLEKQLGKVMRKLAYELAVNDALPYRKITPKEVEDLLGKPPFYRDIYQGNSYAGVVTGLAWTSVGGEILFVETSLSKGKPGKLTLTGNLGDVMKESAVIALEFVKAHAGMLEVDYRVFDQYNMHIHVPEGAVPKDGPSAGITIATSIASALTQRKVRANVAMTGEITLRGKVLPVGGIKEKILAAKRAGITDIVMCKDNKKDIDEIPEIYVKGLEFHFVENVEEVWDFALTKELVAHPIQYELDTDNNEK